MNITSRVSSFLLGLFLISSVSTAAIAAEFSYEDLTSLIRKNHIQNVETLLPLLPAEFRSNYTLLFASRSLQEASALNPRVILFGNDAKFTCAFNGDSSQSNFDSLECFQFRDQERSFDFRMIQFPSQSNTLKQPLFSKSNQSADGKVSCTQCHSADPRPNWDQYSFWKGAYGEDDDYSRDLTATSYLQLAQYADFVKARPSHPRYKWLVQEDYATAPFGDVSISATGFDESFEHRPNGRFVQAVNRLNALRAARLLQAAGTWQRLAFATKTLNCPLDAGQLAQLSNAGMMPDTDMDPLKIFNSLNLSPYAWSTEINGDDLGTYFPIYSFDGDDARLDIDVGMVVVEDLIHGGNLVLKKDVADMLQSVYSNPMTPVDAYLKVINAIVPDPEFASIYEICPELTRVFTATYLEDKQASP